MDWYGFVIFADGGFPSRHFLLQIRHKTFASSLPNVDLPLLADILGSDQPWQDYYKESTNSDSGECNKRFFCITKQVL